MKCFVSVSLLLLVLFSACGRSVGNDGVPRPVSTDAVLDYQRHCHYWMWENGDDINWRAERCREGNPNPEICDEIAAEEVEELYDNWYACLDHLPMVDEDCRTQLDHANQDQDTDGDGISDYNESFMSLNPCEVCSYGGVEGVDCDADLDFDGDGIPNGEDRYPACSLEVGIMECFF